jgi:hypothetical protein
VSFTLHLAQSIFTGLSFFKFTGKLTPYDVINRQVLSTRSYVGRRVIGIRTTRKLIDDVIIMVTVIV